MTKAKKRGEKRELPWSQRMQGMGWRIRRMSLPIYNRRGAPGFPPWGDVGQAHIGFLRPYVAGHLEPFQGFQKLPHNFHSSPLTSNINLLNSIKQLIFLGRQILSI